MDDIKFYLSANVNQIEKTFTCSPETRITLFCVYFCRLERDVSIEFISRPKQQEQADSCILSLNVIELLTNKSFKQEKSDVRFVNWCKLPCAINRTDGLIYSGLCNILRLLVLIAKNSQSSSDSSVLDHVLGHKDNCLKACEHVSPWTTFCESKIPTLIREVDLRNRCDKVTVEELCIPSQLLSFEDNFYSHLSIPNHNKILMKMKKRGLIDESCVSVPHYFAESAEMMLTDIILFPCIHLYLTRYKNYLSSFRVHLPKVFEWYTRMCNIKRVNQASIFMDYKLLDLASVKNAFSCDSVSLEIHRDVLTKRYREKINERWKLKEDDVKPSLQCLENAKIEAKIVDHPRSLNDGYRLDWLSLPHCAHPTSGGLPVNRVDRKCQQIENLATAIQHIAKPGDTIVDFCSGGGHLGVVLAYLLPECHVIMIENKEESVSRANKRILELGLKNATQYQCNMEYYNGPFDIGVCLHACGVATDMVFEQCRKNKASFVICPCCYGGIKKVGNIEYPRSDTVKNAGIKQDELIVLGHVADQTQVDIPQYELGEKCMGLIDTDRALFAEENNYAVSLCKLKPTTCTTKNNLLIGIYNDRH
ncbi:glutathione S-transferase C-terminal domain-containing protein-like [Tubulanus polymorphus]|uniref:glutathione S-transferase C-terminal domain-containing protein-like n=1 Tax=Tubulanus polymorphus TaxID=672921 RepID=UPI003DA68758